jgi:hypothetical protein
MKVILLTLGILMFLVILGTGALNGINHNKYIIGGEYVVHRGEISHGNLELAFAQVTLEEGSHIDGAIHSFSSAVNIHGSVSGNILSIGSDIKLVTPAKVKYLPHNQIVFPYVILLPEMARWNPILVH